ncbi:hypothetical protein Q5O14_08925 [Eubacteriaceae bacterium ES2]|nr:hypothetical protein Q5O14_08925 [Eubacteriaceae bacterium ES2]
MKKDRFILGVLSIVLMASVVTACSSTEASETATTTQTEDSAIYGQISAVDDTSLTIEVGEMTKPSGDAGQQPAGDDNATPPDNAETDATTEATETGETPPEAPEGSTDGTQSSQGGGSMSQITLTGETKTLTITDATTIITMAGNPDDISSSSTEGSISDLIVGATVKITLESDDEIATIEIMGGGGQPADAATTTES